MRFNCTKCGACCMLVGRAVNGLKLQYAMKLPLDEAELMLKDFPYGFKQDGSCEKYDPVVGCTIYEQRPQICRVDKMLPIYQKMKGWTIQTYHEQLAATCNEMISLLNLPGSFMIPPGKESQE